MRFTPSIRTGLTAWYSLVLLLMTAIYATATFFAVRHESFEQLDEELHEEPEAPEGFLATAAEIGRLAAVIHEQDARLESSFGQLRRFTADAAHELRTPLTAGPPDQPAHEHVNQPMEGYV